MKDSFFLDSSVIIYTIDGDIEKKSTTIRLLEKRPIISTQVINEISNVMRKKFSLDYSSIFEITSKIIENSNLVLIDYNSITLAYYIAGTYNYSYYDSLIISSALDNNCNILYSEDMQHNQIVEKRLRIVNPFRTQE